jgi:putative hydrolase of the HAD superfamily
VLIPRPTAVLFDLFHTLASVPPPALSGEPTVPELLGVDSSEWQRRYYDDDVLGRCTGRTVDAVEAMRLVTHAIDPTVPAERIHAAVESRRKRFEVGLVNIDHSTLAALDRLRNAGVRLGLVSDAGADDVESWVRSPLRERLDATVFSYEVGVRKPDPRIYAHALQLLGVDGADAIFVGDGGSDEHRGARALGMKTVLVTRLISHWQPEVIAERQGIADWEFADVCGFVDALAL